jgi:hypothetical protein
MPQTFSGLLSGLQPDNACVDFRSPLPRAGGNVKVTMTRSSELPLRIRRFPPSCSRWILDRTEPAFS